MKRKIHAIFALAILAGLGGCSVQDPDQPSIGSISVQARSDNKAAQLKKAPKAPRR